MVSTYTPNINLEEPARGDQVGTWDTPVNNNMTLIDLVTGGLVNIAVAGAGIVLAPAQYQCKTIVLQSTLTASITITFPTSFTKSYEILNQTTGSSNFTITLRTTSALAEAICSPPGETVDVVNISGGYGFRYKNLGRVGSYWDHAGSSVPNWVSGCTIPPYLLCDGTAFSSFAYPNLRNYLGAANTPDARGRARYALDDGTGRITGVLAGGNTLLAGGGDQLLTAHNHTGTTNNIDRSLDHNHKYNSPGINTTTGGGGFACAGAVSTAVTGGINTAPFTDATLSHLHTFTTDNSGTGGSQNLPPLYVSGITLIRAG